MNKTAESQIARRITLLRKSAGVGLTKFSTATGIAPATLTGETKMNVADLAAASKFLNVTAASLLAGISE